MSGINSAENKLRNLHKQSKKKQQGTKVSVVFFDQDGNIDWPSNCNSGVLAVPRPMTEEQWEQRCPSL